MDVVDRVVELHGPLDDAQKAKLREIAEALPGAADPRRAASQVSTTIAQ